MNNTTPPYPLSSTVLLENNPGKNIFTRTYWMVIAEAEGKPTMHLNLGNDARDDGDWWSEDLVFDVFFVEDYAHTAAEQMPPPYGDKSYTIRIVPFTLSPVVTAGN